MLSEGDIKKRLPVWEALSELFLDTELDEVSHRYIARVITESGFSAEQVHHILWEEVFPAVGDNLRCVAGEWAGFDLQWLEKRILSVSAGKESFLPAEGMISVSSLVDITRKEWHKVCTYLPNDYSQTLLLLSERIEIKKPKKWWPFK